MDIRQKELLRFFLICDCRFRLNCTAFLTYFIENYPQSVEETKRGGAEFWSKFK